MINDGCEREYLDHIPYGAPPGGIIKIEPFPLSFILFVYLWALSPIIVIFLILHFIIFPYIFG